MNEELIAKAKAAKSAEELLALAKENNYPLTEGEAQNYFNQFHATGELSDDELDQVGGGCGGDGGETYQYTSSGYLIIPDPDNFSCSNFRQRAHWKPDNCSNCKSLSTEGGSSYCSRKLAIPPESP